MNSRSNLPIPAKLCWRPLSTNECPGKNSAGNAANRFSMSCSIISVFKKGETCIITVASVPPDRVGNMPIGLQSKREMSTPNRNVLILEGYQRRVAAPLSLDSYCLDGARCQGFDSPRKNREPLTAPRRSEYVLRREKGEVRKSWPIGHFYLAGIGHFYLAVTQSKREIANSFR